MLGGWAVEGGREGGEEDEGRTRVWRGIVSQKRGRSEEARRRGEQELRKEGAAMSTWRRRRCCGEIRL